MVHGKKKPPFGGLNFSVQQLETYLAQFIIGIFKNNNSR